MNEDNRIAYLIEKLQEQLTRKGLVYFDEFLKLIQMELSKVSDISKGGENKND